LTSTPISAEQGRRHSIQLDFIKSGSLQAGKKTGGARRPPGNVEKLISGRLDLAPQESMEMHQAVFQRRLVWPGFRNALPV